MPSPNPNFLKEHTIFVINGDAIFPPPADNTISLILMTKNLLNKETSPYLLQHKDNPVNWYPWSEEAFKNCFN